MSLFEQKFTRRAIALLMVFVLGLLAPSLPAQRQMENLGRGVVAVRKSSTEAFISWRLLALDPSGIGFNLYRSANGGAAVKLNPSVLTAGTNYIDNTVSPTVPNAYHVCPVIGGVEQAASAAFTLPANTVVEPLFRIPLQTPANRMVHNVWVGDVDGDGEYEYFACWLPTTTGLTQKLQAYERDGTLLWEVDFGPNSVDSDNIYVTSATVAAGQWDGITVYDMDGDGRSEVIVKSANGVTFGNGATLAYGDNLTQFISILNGQTGAELTRALLPNPWLSLENRPLGTLFGIGYPDGFRPSLMIHAKSREGTGGFHQINSSWDYRDGVLSQRWSKQWSASDPASPPNNHQMRLLDLDGDGTDEMMPGMYALNSNGTLRYDLGDQGIVHGDRFHVGDLDPNRVGLEHYGIQQFNPTNLIEFMADASTGQPIWMHTVDGSYDSARGSAVDIDPAYPGCEVWSFYGIRTAAGVEIAQEPNRPYPNLTMWWDGDFLGENLHEEQVEKWNPATQSVARLLTGYQYDAAANGRHVPVLYGDILGDWREEIVQAHWDQSELIVFTTYTATSNRLYTLAQNPAYRNCLTVKGYVQQNIPDYFLGNGMSTPPAPAITYTVNVPPAVLPSAPSGLAATAVSGNQIDLTWTDNSSNETLFKIERSTDGVYFTQIATVGANVTGYSNTGLTPSTAYTYRIRAFNSGGNSAYSSTANATTPASAPAAPTGLTATPGSNQVILSWGASAGATSYNVKRSTTSGGSYTTLASPGSTSHADLTAVNGTTYYYVVSAVNATGESANSTQTSATPAPWMPLMQDSGADGIVSVEVEHHNANVSQGGKSWTVNMTGGYSGDSAMAATPNTGSAIVTGYTTNSPRLDFQVNFTKTGTHYIWVRGLGATVNDDSCHVGLDGAAVSTSDNIGSFPTSWGWINRSTETGTPLATINVTSTGLHTVNIWMREDGFVVDKLVLTVNASYAASGTGPAESPREGGGTPPPAPTNPLAAAMSDSQIDLNWTASSGATSYNVKRSTTSGGPYTTVAPGVTGTSYSDTDLTASTTYYYVVSAVNTAGESANSAQASATTQSVTIPSAPASPAATAVSASQIDVSWAASSGATSYNVKRSTTSGGPYTTVAPGVTGTSYSNTGLSASTTYYYVISAVNTAGESADSTEATATTSPAPAPAFVAAGAVANGTNAVTPALPAGIQTGDILLLFVETAAQSCTITNQNGGTWSTVTGALQSTGAAGGATATQISVFWSRYNGSQGAPTVSDSGDHQVGRMIAIRGAVSSGSPWNVVAGGVEATSDTSGSIPGAATTVVDTLVVVAVAANLPDANGTSQFSGWTNSSLTNLTERTDNTANSGNGGGLGIATGVMSSSSTYGATSVTHAASAAKAMVSIAIQN